MSRTRTIFLVIIGLALMVILAGVAVFFWAGSGQPFRRDYPRRQAGGAAAGDACHRACRWSQWSAKAAKQFNAEGHTLEDGRSEVTVVAMDGLAAMGRYDGR